MDSGEVSFINIMEISLIRKKILEYLSNFKDINCLASTCWKLNQIINNEKITRSIDYDFGQINIRYVNIDDEKKLIDVEEQYKLGSYAFIKQLYLSGKEIIESEEYNKKRFNCNDTVEISFRRNVNLSPNVLKSVPFIRKLAKQYDINCEERKNLTILKLQDVGCNTSSFFLLHVLPYLHHENMNTIIFPIRFFSNDVKRYKDLLNGIFDGFPRLYKLEIDLSLKKGYYGGCSMEKSAVDEVMKQLSKKKDATVHFTFFGDRYSRTTDYFLVFFEISMKYGVKVTLCEETLLQLEKHKISSVLKLHNCSIEHCVTHFIGRINYMCFDFHDWIGSMRRYENLEKVTLMLKINYYDKVLEKSFQAFRNTQALRNLKKVVEFELIVLRSPIPLPGKENEIEILHKNIKHLVQLLPNSAKRLLLYGIPKLTYDITRTIERYMPNIEVLSLYNISFEKSDCLSVFTRLKVVTISTSSPIEIPDNVNLFAIYTKESTKNDTDQKLIDEYSKKFSKRLIVGSIKNIFFNDINDFKHYRHLTQIESFLKYKKYFQLL
uniref:F-box domain-containing protein n=1 Tax=Strongyloides papillosus TaxID=174720 RepID=A0A0N5BVB1_STREA